MNIRQHQQDLRGFVSWYAISIARAYPDATVARRRGNSRLVVRDGKITTVRRPRQWDDTATRWAGYAGTVCGWTVAFAVGALAGWLLMWALGYG